MLKLSEVKSILREYNIHPSKRLGQNFLIDRNIKDKIIDSIRAGGEDVVLEIGPGLGALTEDLHERAKRVIAIEKDKRLCDFLLKQSCLNCHCEKARSADEAISKKRLLRFARNDESEEKSLKLINDDFLDYEFEDISSKLIVVGNLPYSISSPILNKLIDNRNSISSIYVTTQAEFGGRIVASAGTRDYGSLSCYVQFYGDARILFKVPRGAFFPVPEVDSCFLKISFEKDMDSSIDQELLFKIIRASFEKRRKTILNSMASSGIFKSKEDALSCLVKARISPDRRPETISLQEFIVLSRASSLHFCH